MGETPKLRLIGGDAAVFGPEAQGFDLLGHGDREGGRSVHGFDDALGGKGIADGEGAVHGGEDRLLDLGAGAAFRFPGEKGEVEETWVALALLEVDAEDLQT